jgi:hypothetical protein
MAKPSLNERQNYISQEPAGDDPPDEKIVDAQNNVLVPPYVLGAPQYAC